MNIRQPIVSIIGIVALALGMTSGIVSADTGTGTLQVGSYPCDPAGSASNALTVSFIQGDLDFGTVAPVGNGIVTAAAPMQVKVVAGCATEGWALDLSVGPFQSASGEISPSKFKLTGGGVTFTLDVDYIDDLELRWDVEECHIVFPSGVAAHQPSVDPTVSFAPDGSPTSMMLFATLETTLCNLSVIPPTRFDYFRGNGVTVASWDAELDLRGLTLEAGGTYVSEVTVEVSPSV